jgi:phosphoglycolate phosphatase
VNFPIAIRAVAFDLDGTLVDTLPDLHEAGCRMLTGLGHEPLALQITRSFIGDGIEQLVRRLLREAEGTDAGDTLLEPSLREFRRHYRDVVSLHSRPYPGVVAGLQELRDHGLPLACITNKAGAFTGPLLKDLALTDNFQVIVSGDTLPRKKPDPLPLHHVADRMGIAVSELLMVGDSINDVLAARAAGSPVFCVPWGYSRQVRELHGDAIVDSLSQILSLTYLPQS